jgi:hypothetical protein
MFSRFLTLLALVVIAAVPAAQSARLGTLAVARSGSLPPPTDLRGFLLRPSQPPLESYPRTPSFAWNAYDGAQSYDFQLATSQLFDERTMVWSTSDPSTLKVPVAAVPVALPWMTGHRYALYARVRAHTAKGTTRWSAPFGFNMRWTTDCKDRDNPCCKPPDYTCPLPPAIPGLVRWKPVDGATSYEVRFVEPDKIIKTTTNVADEREYYTLLDDARLFSTVQWRVRAVRQVYGSLPSGIPRVSYGPWSTTFISTNPAFPTGLLADLETVSTVFDTGAPGSYPHNLTPGYVFNGDPSLYGLAGQHRLFRVYVATDRQCVNIVFTGSVVGSPAYAPRTSGPLALSGTTPTPTTPTTTTTTTTTTSTTTTSAPTPGAFLADGPQSTFDADGLPVTPDEQGAGTSPTTGAAASATTAASALPSDFQTPGPFVDLWDIGTPNGRYWWTVVPVSERGFRDLELPQDACAQGRVKPFGKASAPTLSSSLSTYSTVPYASGLSTSGQTMTARSATPIFYRSPLVAWEPAPGATGYEVQWSRTNRPWRTASKTPAYTAATSMLLPDLAPGTWYYRVRGIDPYMPGQVKQMTWSSPVMIKLAKPTFVDQSAVTVRPVRK